MRNLLFLFLLPVSLFAQKDTQFWFAAPDVLQNPPYDYDRPVAFRFSTYGQAANITLFQPANPNFPVQTLYVPANGTGTMTFGPFMDLIETRPANTIQNKGILIQSTAPVSVYYEILSGCACNPELFSLKGRNALGVEFYVPFQTVLDNSTTDRWSAFDVVATENNTEVTITPTRDIVGHSANQTFTITLQLGQSWSGRAVSPLGADHAAGTHITSNKPIAVTMKDDLVNGSPLFFGECRDLIGDQIIPITKIGKQYVIQKGGLNNTEFGFALATEDNTQVWQDGLPIANLNAGQQAGIAVTNAHFITADKPIYVLQISGIGCEVAGEVLPSLDCSGSEAIRFVRTTAEEFNLMLVTRAGNEDNFLLNGSNSIILPIEFSPVPGSNGEWVSTVRSYGTGVIPINSSIEVRNTSGVFHMGILNGMPTETGARFGFFSDFGNIAIEEDSIDFCQGDTTFFRGMPVFLAGDYADTVTTTEGCDTIFRLNARYREYITTYQTISFCTGDTAVVNGQIFTQNAQVSDTIEVLGGCDTIQNITLQFANYVNAQRTLNFCEGDIALVNGNAFIQNTTLTDTIEGVVGCDTILTINLNFSGLVQRSETRFFCPGDTIWIFDNQFTTPGISRDTITAVSGCDTVITTTRQWNERPTTTRTLTLCPGQSVTIGGVAYTSAATVTDTLRGQETACDTVRTTSIVLEPLVGAFLSADTSLCAGDQVTLRSQLPDTRWPGGTRGATFLVGTPGLYVAEATSPAGCPLTDSVRVVSCCAESGMYVPNAFSPDDNGQNDQFLAFPTERCRQYTLRVYDRWGELLFESDQPDVGWDGTFRGQKMPAAVYVWVIEFGGTERGLRRTGDVHLIR
jgi:gliding motility-associated-like protein